MEKRAPDTKNNLSRHGFFNTIDKDRKTKHH